MSRSELTPNGGAAPAGARDRRAGILLGSALLLLCAMPSHATHFRFSHVTWVPRQDVDPNAIDFTVQAAWRRSAFRSGNDRCIDPVTLNDTNCTGPDGYAGVGDIIHERQGNSRFDPGDSSGLIGGPGSLDGALLFLVSSVDVASDWLFGTALDPASLPAAGPSFDTAISHVYAGPGDLTAHLTDCCRLSGCRAPNAHMNNPDTSYRTETRVNVGAGKSSPVSNLPPIILCPENGLCQFSVPVSDDDLDPVSFRLATSNESGLVTQPGGPQCPNPASIDPNTGLYSWNTTGCLLSGDPGPEPPTGGCADSDLNTLYSTQVMIEEPAGGSRVAVDFLIHLVSSCVIGNAEPVFDGPTPLCGSTISTNPGGPLSFSVQASDPDAADTVQLNATGLPTGAGMSPGLPTSGQPAASGFTWIPTAQQQGQHVVVFNATDGCGAQTLCSITIDVSDEICDDGIDNDGDSLADCADPDCDDTSCDDGLFCTESDRCTAGACSGTARSCDDGDACTVDSCDEGGDACVQDAAAADGNACQDGLFCTDGDQCMGGACVSGAPRDCGIFGGECTTGVCNEAIDQCEPEPSNDGAPCDDGIFCTAGEFCTGGSCSGGSTLSCDDGNSCTSDVCDEIGGQCVNDVLAGCCGNTLVEAGEECDDGNQIGGDGCEADCSRSTACSFAYGTGSEIFVGGCGSPSHATVQQAVDAAIDGDIVSVCPGTFVGAVVIDQPLTLRSVSGPEVTELSAAGTTIDIRSSGVAIEDLTVVSQGGSAIEADAICPLGQSSCASPAGSNLLISGNIIRDSVSGIRWSSRVDCVEISSNELIANGAPIALLQASSPPAILVEVGGENGGIGVGNAVRGGGAAGAAVEVAGIEVSIVANEVEDAVADGVVVRDVTTAPVTIAANAVRRSGGDGVVLGNLAAGSSLVENEIDTNAGDGVRILSGAAGAVVRNNNITGNGVGLGNEASAGVLDATLNWWDSQTGPSGLFAGVGDSIENRAAATTDFIEFLCRPFPEGFASVDGVCSVETAELRQLVPGRKPDLDPFGRFVVFESDRDMDVDGRSAMENGDLSQEVFLLDRRPRPKWGGVCLGGLLPCDFDNVQSCTDCEGNSDCPGDPAADPIVLNGECVQITQLTDGATGLESSGDPRITGRGKDVVLATTGNQMGTNPDGSSEVLSWTRRLFEKGANPHTMLTDGAASVAHAWPAPSLSGRFIAMESNADPIGENPDGNTEIFVYSVRKGVWFQVTRTTGFCTVSGEDCSDDGDCEGAGDVCQPVENRLPATIDGKRIDLRVERRPAQRQEGVRRQQSRSQSGDLRRQDQEERVSRDPTGDRFPGAGREYRPTGDTRAKLMAFSSNGDYAGANGDGTREIFVWSAKGDPSSRSPTPRAGRASIR